MAIGETFPDSMYKDGLGSIDSCSLVFRVIPEHSPFQTQILNLGLETKAIPKVNSL
jgi:hypothetical protein